LLPTLAWPVLDFGSMLCTLVTFDSSTATPYAFLDLVAQGSIGP